MKLSIELVPETCWFSNVRTHVTEKSWEFLKNITYGKSKHVCEICSKIGDKWPLECHEVWHYDDKSKIQTLQRLLSLCPACHEVKHFGFANTRDRGDDAFRHLMHVNEWPSDIAKKYVESMFDVWENRSQYNWGLNIDWLDQFLGKGVDFKEKTQQILSSCEVS